MPKLTINRPQDGIYWPNKSTQTSYINDAKTDLGLMVYPGLGITLRFLLPDKKTTAYGELNLKPEQVEDLIEKLTRALQEFYPSDILKDKES